MSAIKDATDQVKDTAGDATGSVKDAAGGATGGLRSAVLGSFTDAARDILSPAIQQMSQQAAERAANYAKEQGPKLIKEQVLPQVMKSAGVTNPADLAKAGVGKAGEMMSGAGGITGMFGKIASKFGGRGGRGKGVATGYGQKRRIMVQQDHYVPVNVKDVYRAWTQLEWPQFMHRVNTLDRQVGQDEGGESRYAIGVKGFLFKKNFTAQVREQQPFGYIVWNTTQGNLTNTGRISFCGVADDLTLVVVNLDLAPSGPREKVVRGARYHKRAIRGDLHRFGAKVQMMAQEELDDLEGDLTTIEGNKITQTHDQYVEEHPEEQNRAERAKEARDEEGQDQAEAEEGEEPQAAQQSDEAEDEDEDREESEDETADEEEPADEADEDEADDEEDAQTDEDDEAEEEEEPEDEGDAYDDMSLADLRKELRSRDLGSRGKRAELIDRLRDDDEDEAADEEDEEKEEPEEEEQPPARRPRRPAGSGRS